MTKVSAAFIGTTEVQRIYSGNNLMYQKFAGWRYVRFQGFGDQMGEGTTRLVELEAFEGTTNHMRNRVPISGEPVSTGGVIATVTDGNVAMVSGQFPVWWAGVGIPTLTYDLGQQRLINQIRVYMFSTLADPRQTRFRVWVSNDNATWVMVADYRNNTTPQPPTGFTFNVPAA